MTETMREKIARRMAASQWPGSPWPSDFSEAEREDYLKLADACLSAIAEDYPDPSERTET